MKVVLLFFLVFILSNNSHALPIDWHGVLGFDTTSIDSYRRLDKKSDDSNFMNANNGGTQELPLGGSGGKDSANWQSYVFRIEPHIIINDSATIKSEWTTGYGRGGRLGDATAQSNEPGFGNALYPYAFNDGSDAIVLNKLYAELYSDTATYVLGRHSAHYGLGVVYNSGEDAWDRFSFVRDGITAKIKLSNFNIEPFWARVNSKGSLTKATRVKEIGVSLVYDSIERDMSFGLLYAKKKSSAANNEYQQNISGTFVNPDTGTYTGSSLGKTDVKIIDVFFKKSFGMLDFGIEVPILSGTVGSVFGTDTKYKAKAIIAESKIKASNSWTFGINAGQVSGDDGNSTSFDAMYLNPNYQIANLLFRYNLRAVSSQDGTTSSNVYDSHIHNTMYAKAFASYTLEKWQWDLGVIWAKADQTAQLGKTSYNHTTNKTFTANANQEDDLGTEIDLNFKYLWNSEISVGGGVGYLFTGDYYGFNNTSSPNKVKNSYVLQLNTAIHF